MAEPILSLEETIGIYAQLDCIFHSQMGIGKIELETGHRWLETERTTSEIGQSCTSDIEAKLCF
jgi:hypothetical protein